MKKQEPSWEANVLFFSALFLVGAFVKYFFGYDARWLGAVVAVTSPIGIFGLGAVFAAKGFRGLLKKRLAWWNGAFYGKKAQLAGLVLLFASGVFFWLGIRTLIWFVNSF